jgi:hypothetical protein
MYQLPEEPKHSEYIITEDIIDGNADLFTARQEEEKKESA